jgi:hypothetical protein
MTSLAEASTRRNHEIAAENEIVASDGRVRDTNRSARRQRSNGSNQFDL